MRLAFKHIGVAGMDVGDLEDREAEAPGAIEAGAIHNHLEFDIAAVARRCVVGPALPDTAGARSRAHVEGPALCVGDEVHAAHAGQCRTPGGEPCRISAAGRSYYGPKSMK